MHPSMKGSTPVPGIPRQASRRITAHGSPGIPIGPAASPRLAGSIPRILSFGVASPEIHRGCRASLRRNARSRFGGEARRRGSPRLTINREFDLADGCRIHIRPAVPDEAGVVLAYLRKVGGESDNLTFGPEGPGLSEAEEREYLAGVAASDNALVLLALHDGAVVGALTFEGGRRPRTRHTGELGISVTASFTGSGIGRALLEMLIEWAEQGGVIRKLNLRTRVDNLGAIRLYERLGWVAEGRITRDQGIDGVYTDTLFMGRPVDHR